MKIISFEHVNVFDGKSDIILEDAIVTVADGIIKDICPYSEKNTIDTTIYDEVEVIDCKGMFLMPGMIDCHANIIGLITEEQKYGITPKTISSTILRGIKEGKNCIYAGVTTIRVDTSGHHGIYPLRDAFDSGAFLGPHMIIPGRAICTTCGHGWNFGNYVADGPWEIRKAVRKEIMEGADWVKLMITGGAGTSTERMEDQQMCREEIFAGIDEAHARGKKCFAHLTVDKAINDAIDAGIDSVEHGILMEKNTAGKMAKKGIYLVPTLGVYRRLVDRGKRGLVPDYMYKKSLQVVERHAQSFKYALDENIKIASGTDSGQDWYPLGTSMLSELEIMNEEGMSNVDVLRSTTSNAANLLDLTKTGSIKRGFNGDILIVKGNPLEKMSDIRNTRFVLKNGEIVYRGSDKINNIRPE